jgi:uracil-DNA glycosylase
MADFRIDGRSAPSAATDLFFEIARCANVKAHFEETPTPDQLRCRDVIATQKAPTLADFQVPEPWCGDIESAPILFVSSNPSIDEQSSAFASDPDSELWDSHVNLFFDQRWSRDGIYTVASDGERSTDWVRYWAGARARAAELLRRPPNAGRDYALTEVVHCKSRDEDGVMSALPECARRYLRRVLLLSSAHVIVIFGDTAWRLMSDIFGISGSARVSGPLEIEGHQRMVVCLPHPNARKARTVRALVREEDVKRIQAFLSR